MAIVTSFRREILGKSTEGEPIEGVFFCADDCTALDIMLIGVFHGDEGISGDLLNQLIRELASETIPNPDFIQHATLIVPVLNPDGLKRQTRGNANAVDLNRNFPATNWEHAEAGGKYYSGPSAASEVETQLVLQLLEIYKPKKIVAVHSPYRLLNYDGAGKALAEVMAERSGYEVTGDIGYPTPGSFGTYCAEKGIQAVTLELPPGVEDPPDPEVTIKPQTVKEVWRDNALSLVAAINF